MALGVKYTLNFSTNTGANIEYELDILKEGFSGSATKIKGTSSPIMIDWKNDRDIYKPLMGSRATISLLLEDGDTIDDLNGGAEFDFFVRLRYKDSDDNLHDVWRGWIEPNDGEEIIGSYPIELKFIATDGLSKLELPVREPDERGNVLLLHYILFALEKTGMDMDVYLDSSIINEAGNEIFTTVQVDEKAFLDEDTTKAYPFNADNRKDVLEGILTAFNCSVRQSKGRWYIINNSLHTDLDTNDQNTFKVYEFKVADDDNKIDGTNYVPAASDVTETLVKTFDNTSDTDLKLKGESLFLNARYPYGSVENTFSSLRLKNSVPNWNFDDTTTGWEVHPDSAIQTLSFFKNAGSQGNAIATTRNIHKNNFNGNDDIWFQVDDAYAIDITRKYLNKFEFTYRFISFNSIDKVKIPYQIYAELDSNISYPLVCQTVDGVETCEEKEFAFNRTVGITNISSNRIFYNFDYQYWSPIEEETSPFREGSQYVKFSESSSRLTWKTESVTLRAITESLESFNGFVGLPTGDINFFVRFGYPYAYNGNNLKSSANSGNIRIELDNVSLKADLSNVPEPTFERTQDNFSETYEYETNVIGSAELDTSYYELLDTTQYWEHDQTTRTDDTARTLEEVVTNQKLKDLREQLYYFNADFINNDSVPVTPVDVIRLDTTVTKYSQDYDIVIDGCRFDVKNNVFKAKGYVPNQYVGGSQDRDYGDFTPYDVVLFGRDRETTSRQVRYYVSFVLEAQDDDGNTVANGLEGARVWESAVGLPNEVINVTRRIKAKDGYEIDGNLSLLNTADKPAPTYATNFQFAKVGSEVEVTFSITMPEESEFEEAYILGTVDELVGNNTKVIFSATDNMTNATVTTTAITEIGPIGATEKYYYYVEPSDTYEMKVSALTVNLNSVKDGNESTDTDVSGVITSSDIRKIQSGTGVIVEVPFKYVETSPVYAKLTFSGTATTVPNIDTVTAQVTVTKAGSDVANWSITDDDVTYTCVPGTPLRYVFEINPESGRAIPPGNVSVGSLEESFLGNYTVSGENTVNAEAQVWLEATCPTSNSTASITINATTTDGPGGEDEFRYQITWTEPDNVTIHNEGTSADLYLAEGATSEYIFSFEADTGYNVGDLLVDTDNLPTGMTLVRGPVFQGDLEEKEYVEYTFQITGQSADDTGNAIPFNTGSASEASALRTMLINIATDDGSINADVDTNQIRIPWSLADKGEAISSRTFKIYSSETTMMYNATGDVSFTITHPQITDPDDEDSTINETDASIACTATSISNGVITATITGTLPDTRLTSDGIADITVEVTGPAETVVPATATNSTLTRSDNFGDLNINGGYCFFDVESDGPWELYAWDGFGSDGKLYVLSRNSGTDGKYNGIRFDFTNEFITKTGSISTYVYLMKPNLFTDAQIQIIQDRDGTSAERTAISTIFTTAANQLADRVQISMKSTASQQPGFSSWQIEIVSSLPASPNANKVYIVTG